MRASPRRRRALLLLALALAAGALAAAQVRSSVREVESRVGELVPVVVASEAIPAGKRFHRDGVEGLLAVRQVPERYVPPDGLRAPRDLLGTRTAAPIAPGGYVTAGVLETRGAERGAAGSLMAPGERIAEVSVASVTGAAEPGVEVDVVVTTTGESGRGRSYLALQRVQLLELRPGGSGRGGSGPGTGAATASLRVTLEQAVMLTAAQNFGREIRLLARAPSDRRRAGPTSVAAAEL